MRLAKDAEPSDELRRFLREEEDIVRAAFGRIYHILKLADNQSSNFEVIISDLFDRFHDIRRNEEKGND
jgi:hypothetical protein